MPPQTRSQKAVTERDGDTDPYFLDQNSASFSLLITDAGVWNGNSTTSSIARENEGRFSRQNNGSSSLRSRNSSTGSTPRGSDIPPTYTINLGLPPEERYVELALEYQFQIEDLITLFDEVVEMSGIRISIDRVKQIARLLLRRVHDSEQTKELRGISKATGVDMYLMVAFNVLLDLFMGCTSGGVKITEDGTEKMVHFRTLDWGMDVLRRVVVQLEYVEKEGGPIIARAVTYVGFVGILTGVRENLSLSLNFRGLHNNSKSTVSNILYTKTLLMVLLGLKPSIASTLRHIILPPKASHWAFWHRNIKLPTLEDLKNTMPSLCTTSCYLIFCNGKETTTIEKDRVTGLVRTSSSFITATNHDVDNADESVAAAHEGPNFASMAELFDESLTRSGCVQKCYNDALKSNPQAEIPMVDVEKWMVTYPILNECTHYAVIMDPIKGELRWARRWRKPYKPSKATRALHTSPWHA